MTFEAAEQIQDCQTIFCVKWKMLSSIFLRKKNAKCFLNFFKKRIFDKKSILTVYLDDFWGKEFNL